MTDYKVDKTIYFVRHGRSVANASPVFQAPDSPLDEEGRKQAAKIAERVSHLSFDLLISSTFQRAHETADAVANRTGKTVEYSDLFVERIKPTSINGKPYTDTAASATWKVWDHSLYTSGVNRIEDGENFDDLILRADKALAYLENKTEQSIVVVTHGYFLRTIIARALFGNLLSPELFKRFQKLVSMENTGLTIMKYQGGFEETPTWRLSVYNDHAHLG